MAEKKLTPEEVLKEAENVLTARTEYIKAMEVMMRQIVEEVIDEKLKEVWDYLYSVEQNSLPIEAGEEIRTELTAAIQKALGRE